MKKGHPIAIYYLFLVELWERFAYYGMRALLTLYMVQHLFSDMARKDADNIALGTYAAFAALVYATPVIGGMLADRFMGYRKSIITGSILMAVGLFLMLVPQPLFFYIGLGVLVAGNGLFKPNISSMVGSLYQPGDPRRDGGFTIFYMGVNIGALLSPLACGWVAYAYGWTYGFGLAGIGMLVGLFIFKLGIGKGVFKNAGLPPDTVENRIAIAGISKSNWSIILAILTAPVFALLIWKNDFAGYLLYIILALVLFIVLKSFLEITRPERERIIAIFILAMFSTVFWSFFEQAGTTLTLFAERNVDLRLINAAQSNMINPIYIIALSVPFSMLWTWMSSHKFNPFTPYKFAYGIAQLGVGFLIFAYGARYASETGMVPMLFLILGYFFITTGELFISPIGLSMVTRLSPVKVVSFMMGVWYLSISFAHYIAGFIAKFTTRDFEGSDSFLDRFSETVSGLNAEVVVSKQMESFNTLLSYTNVFTSIAAVAFVAAILALLTAPLIKKLMHGEH